MAKRIMNTTVRMTGVTKAVITGGGRANKARPAEATTIYAENADLGEAVIGLARQVLNTEKEPYKFESRKALEAAIEKASRLADLLGGRGAGSVNQGACASTSKQLVAEINNMASQTFPPSMKTNILYIVQLHAQLVEKFSEATNTDLKINESKRLEVLSKAFPIIAKEVFPHMPDLTYAQPLMDACNLVPRITYDVRELVKTAAMYTAGETYATNSSKMLFYLLNDIRRNAMAGFPPCAYDSRFPQVGPVDYQFQLSSAEFANGIAETSTSPRPELTEESAPQLDGMNFDDMTYAPTHSQEDEYGMTSSGGPLSMSMSSYGSNDGSVESGEPYADYNNGTPVRAINYMSPNGYGSGMNVGSAPAGSSMPYQQSAVRSSGGYPAPGSAISFGDPSPAPNTPIPQGKFGPPGTNRPAPGMAPSSTPPPTNTAPGFGPGGPGSPGLSKFSIAPGFGPGGPGSPGSAKLPMRPSAINSPGPAPAGPSSAKLPPTGGLHHGTGTPPPTGTPTGLNGGPVKFSPLTLGGSPTPPSTPPPTSHTPPQPATAGFGPKGPGMVKGGFFPGQNVSGSPPVSQPPKQPSPPPQQQQSPSPTLSHQNPQHNGVSQSPGMTPKQPMTFGAPINGSSPVMTPKQPMTFGGPVNGSIGQSNGSSPVMVPKQPMNVGFLANGGPMPGTSPVMTPKQPMLVGSPQGSPKQPMGMMNSPAGAYKQPPNGAPPQQPQQQAGGFLQHSGSGGLPKSAPPKQPSPPVPGTGPGVSKMPFNGGPPKQAPPPTMTPEMVAQQQLLQEQQRIIQEQQQQLRQHQLLLQQREQEELIKQQQEELACIDENRKAEEARQAAEAAQNAVVAAKVAEEANRASALDELDSLDWKF